MSKLCVDWLIYFSTFDQPVGIDGHVTFRVDMLKGQTCLTGWPLSPLSSFIYLAFLCF